MKSTINMATNIAKDLLENEKCCTMITLTIKNAFDYVVWRKITQALIKLGMPKYLVCTIIKTNQSNSIKPNQKTSVLREKCECNQSCRVQISRELEVTADWVLNPEPMLKLKKVWLKIERRRQLSIV